MRLFRICFAPAPHEMSGLQLGPEQHRITDRSGPGGIVKDAPAGCRPSRHRRQSGQERRHPFVAIGRSIDAGRSVQTPIFESAATARRNRQGRGRRIGRDPGDTQIRKQPVGARQEPARMSRLAGRPDAGKPGQHPEEGARDRRIEGETGRQLKQQNVELAFQCTDILEECDRLFPAIEQPALVANRLGHLYGKAEILRHAVVPACPGRWSMPTIKGRVDLNPAEPRRIALERTSYRRKRPCMVFGNAPARRSDNQCHVARTPLRQGGSFRPDRNVVTQVESTALVQPASVPLDGEQNG